MIINSFDDKSEAKINPTFNESAYKLDACILLFPTPHLSTVNSLVMQ